MMENIRKQRNTIMSLLVTAKDLADKNWIEDVNKLLGEGEHDIVKVVDTAIQYLIQRQKVSIFGRKIIDNPYTKYKLAYLLMSSIIYSFGIDEYSQPEFRKRFKKLGNVILPPQYPKKTKFVDESIFQKILSALELRPYLFLLVFILTGARGNAVTNIKLEDIVFKEDTAFFPIHEKGGKIIDCSLPKWVVDDIVTHLKPKKYLIETNFHKPYSRGALNFYLKKHVEPLLGRRWHNHMARHSFATNNIKRGVSIVAIKERLGHSFINTTMRYLHDDYKENQLADYAAGVVAERKGIPAKKPEIVKPKPKKLTKYQIVAGEVKEASATIQEAQETVKNQRGLIDLIDRKRA